ncbi:MAG: type II toxin-antitoxin system RelE/ParE family toxin [Pseudomonadota bacterium]|nr:type II toxin-antitoxin system RelE/ParE family toxin [Pseudomonadota bacterium]
MFDVIFRPKAVKQLRKLRNPLAASQIYDATKALEDWPNCQNVKALVNHQYPYRLRVGNYRVFFSIEDDHLQVVHIEEVRKRDERTY